MVLIHGTNKIFHLTVLFINVDKNLFAQYVQISGISFLISTYFYFSILIAHQF